MLIQMNKKKLETCVWGIYYPSRMEGKRKENYNRFALRGGGIPFSFK